MEPLLLDGDLILVTRRFPGGGHPRRGDVVAFYDPTAYEISLKRVCSLPTETAALKDGLLIIDGKPMLEPYIDSRTDRARQFSDIQWEISQDGYLLLGDNRADSLDSRAYGLIARSAIFGRAWYRYAPSARAGILPADRCRDKGIG